MVQRLPAAAVVDGGPGTDRPGVVELPDQRAHAMGPETAPVGDGGLDGEALLDLAQPDEILEPLGPAEVAEHGGGDALVAALVLLVALEDRGGDVPVPGLGEAADDLEGRVGLEAELRAEPGRDVPVVIEIPVLVPDRPEVHVARAVVVPGIAEGQRPRRGRGGPPVGLRVRRQERGLQRPVQPVVVHEVAVAVGAALGIPGERADKLVVAAPERETGVVLETPDLGPNLRLDERQEVGRRRIERAGEHEVLPDHQPQLVADLVEPVRLVAPAAPDPDHVHVGIGGGLQQVAHGLPGDPAGQRVGGNPVGPLGEDVAVVDAEAEAAARVVRLAHQFDAAQPDAPGLPHIAHGDRQVVEHLSALPRRPPELRVLDGEDRLHRGAGLQRPALAGEADGDLPARTVRDGGRHANLDPTIGVGLVNHDPVDPRRGRGLEPERAVDAEGGKRDVPVPAEIAMRLAQQVTVRNRAVPRLRHGEGQGRSDPRACLDGRVERDRDLVLARPEQRANRHAIVQEGALGAQRHDAVDLHRRDRVGHRQDEIEVGLLHPEGPARDPVPLADPAQIVFVAAMIGVRDQPRPMQRRDPVAGQATGASMAALRIGKVPIPGKVDHLRDAAPSWRRTATHGRDRDRSAATRRGAPWPGRPCGCGRAGRSASPRPACPSPSAPRCPRSRRS